jgi:hypothetical protein
MRTLINLRQFLAVLVLIIVPAALLTAYFRNSGSDSGAASGHHGPADASGASPAPPAAAMDHSKMSGMNQPSSAGTNPQMPQSMPAADPLEAARAQLEASRAQLEASRKALEAANALPPGNPPAPASDGPKPPTPTPQPDGQKHDH